MLVSSSLELGGCGEDVAYPWRARLPCLVVYAKFQFVYTTIYVGLNCDQIFSLIRFSLTSVVYVCGQDEVGSPSVFRLPRNILGGVAEL